MKRCRWKVERIFGSDHLRAVCACGWRGPKRSGRRFSAAMDLATRDALDHMGPTLEAS